MTKTEDRGKAAYEGFRNGMSWPDLAESFGFPRNTERVRDLAERYAKRSGLQWPLATRGRRRIPGRHEIGKVCYEMRNEGESWETIAKSTGISDQWSTGVYKVAQYAKSYADQNGLTWPLAEKKLLKETAETRKVKGAEAYALRSQGKTWEKIADLIGILGLPETPKERLAKIGKIKYYAETYSKQNGLPWPVGGERQFPGGRKGRKRSPERTEILKQAYAWRQSGLSWRQIATQSGITTMYRSGQFNIMNLVRHYALKEGLDWPIEIKTPAEVQSLVEKVFVRDVPPVHGR